MSKQQKSWRVPCGAGGSLSDPTSGKGEEEAEAGAVVRWCSWLTMCEDMWCGAVRCGVVQLRRGGPCVLYAPAPAAALDAPPTPEPRKEGREKEVEEEGRVAQGRGKAAEEAEEEASPVQPSQSSPAQPSSSQRAALAKLATNDSRQRPTTAAPPPRFRLRFRLDWVSTTSTASTAS